MVPTGVNGQREKDPGSAFGPESVPLATGSVSVVYWVPGPFPRPTPVQPDRRRRPPQPLLLCHVGCWTEQQLTPDRGDVNHEPWRRRYCAEEFGYITSQLGEMFAARPGRRESTAGLLGPPAVICRFCPVGGADFYRVTAKIRAVADLYPVVSGMDHPTWRHVILYAPVSRGRRRTPPPEVMRMDDSADRFLELIHQLEDFTHSISPDQAHSEFDETTLQLFWMRWPQLSAWAGSLWRLLSEELAGPSAPHDSELFEIGESG